MRYFLSLVLLFGWTSAYAQSSQRELPSTKELSDGILALNCVDADVEGNGEEITIVITKMGDQLQIVNAPNLDEVAEIENGFVLRSSKDTQSLGFIREKGSDWTIEFLNEAGMLKGVCTNEETFVETIISAVAPKILENANSLSSQLSDAQATITAQIAQIERLGLAELQRALMGEMLEDMRRDTQSTKANLSNTLALVASQQERVAALKQANQALQAAASVNPDDLAQLQADLQVAQTNLQTQGAQLQNTQSELEEMLPLREALAQAIAEQQTIDKKLTESEIKAALLATAQAELREAEAISSEAQRQMAVLSEEVRELMAQIGGLQSILDDYRRRDEKNNVKITNLGSDLNMALAQAASEARRNLALEAVEKKRLAEEAARLAIEAKSLEQYKSDFFGRMRGLLEGIESVRIVGDRFVFSSEVLFPSGGADLSVAGRRQISKVSTLLKNIAEQMPAGIDWILQVDGHTDDQPLLSGSNFGSNWELSQARALSVVVFLVNEQGMEPRRLSANGFGEFQPLNPENTGAARAQNRRIELKLTKK